MKKRLFSIVVILGSIYLKRAAWVLAQGTPPALPTYSNAAAPTGSSGPPPASLCDLIAVFARIINFATTFAIIAFFAMLVVAAFKYLTSGGDPKTTESARNTMTYAVIGMVTVVAAYIVLTLLGNFTKLPLTSFTISGCE